MILMKQRNVQLNAILEGEKMSVSLSASLSISLDDPQSGKKTNMILKKRRNGQSNAILEGEKLSVSMNASLSISLDDPQFGKKPNMNSAEARGEAPPIEYASLAGISERSISTRMGASESLVRHLLIPNPLNKRTRS